MNESHVIVAIVAACLLCLFVNCFTPFASMLGTSCSMYHYTTCTVSTDKRVQLQDLLYRNTYSVIETDSKLPHLLLMVNWSKIHITYRGTILIMVRVKISILHNYRYHICSNYFMQGYSYKNKLI